MPVDDVGIVLLEDLNLRNGRRSSMLELQDAIVAPPEFVLTMDGACTLTLVVAADQTLITSPLIQEKSWSTVLGVRFELAAISKVGSRVTLTYEDAVTAAMRRVKSRQTIKGGSMTRSAIVRLQAKDAGVPALIYPGPKVTVKRPQQRKATVNAWDLTGSLAEEVHVRRFSTGTELVFASDDWLMDRADPITLVEYQGAVGSIDWDLDTGKRASKATVALSATTAALLPGQPITLGKETGPAAGRWLVREFRRPLTSTQATVTLTRARHRLAEPKKQAIGDHGDTSYAATAAGGDAGGTAANAARAKMVAFALAQNGKAYVYGGHGPNAWDCSGLVQAATAAAGHVLPAPSASQAAAVAAAGKGMSIDDAIRTRGALLFKQDTQHHVAISLGNGSTIEAMNPEAGVGISTAAGRGWTSAGWWV